MRNCLAQSIHTGPMAGNPRQSALLRPPAIAIHDERYMAWQRRPFIIDKR
jgi:hypothetical protein